MTNAVAARRSWVLRGVINGFSEEARTRGFASLALARFAFFNVPDSPVQQEAVNSGMYLECVGVGLRTR